MSSYSPHSATYKNLKNVAGMLNSPTFRRASGSTDKEKREKRRSKEMIDAQLKADVSICLEDLKRLRRLGEGGFAIVDLFEWQRGSERVEIAVKRLKTKIPGPPDPLDPDRINWIDPPEHWYATFQAEALLLKALRHPNVVACYGCVQVSRDRELFDSDEDPLMFAQEYCDGGSLLDKVRNPSSYSGREALSWAHDVAAGMDYLHSRNKGVRIAHRDLKLENILLSNGRAKVGDFGLSRLLVGDELGRASMVDEASVHRGQPTPRSAPRRASSVLDVASPAPDVTGMTGSMRYMAPEVYGSENYTHKVDVFSFGILAYELLSRTRAYAENLLTMEQVAKAVSSSGLRPRLPKRWPAELSELLTRCWAQKDGDRPEFPDISRRLQDILAKADAVPSGQPNEMLDALKYQGGVVGCCSVQ